MEELREPHYVGIAFMAIGSIMVTIGIYLAFTVKGQLYNAEEVQAMVAAENADEEERDDQLFDNFDDLTEVKQKRVGVLVAD